MKQPLSLALAAAFILSRCGAKTAEPSLSEQFADCFCARLTEAARVEEELEAAPEDKKYEIIAKLTQQMQTPSCMTDLNAKIKAFPEADQARLERENIAATKKKCSDVFNYLPSY